VIQLSWRQTYIANAISFQLLWFIAVQANEILAVISTSIFLLMHTRIVIKSRRQWLFIGAIGISGWMLESLISNLGVIDFYGAYRLTIQGQILQLAPIWMLCLWLGFATTLISSLYWCADRPLLAAVLGAIAGPCSYWGGAALSGSSFLLPALQVLAIEACLWALLLPALLRAAHIAMQE
jgi:hypothetical protein